MAIKKTKKGPGPGPTWDPNSEAARLKGLKKGLAIMGGMAAAGTAAIASRIKPEARLEQKGLRQEARASRKEKRAAKLTTKASMSAPKSAARKVQKATKLTQKAKGLRTMSQANLKASEEIYKAKNKK